MPASRPARLPAPAPPAVVLPWPEIAPEQTAKRYRGRPWRHAQGASLVKLEIRLTAQEKHEAQQRAARFQLSLSELGRRLLNTVPLPEPVRERPALTDAATAHQLAELRKALSQAVMLATVSAQRHGVASMAIQRLLGDRSTAALEHIDDLIYRLCGGGP